MRSLFNADTAPATVGRVKDQQEATVFTHGKALHPWRDPPCESGDQPLVMEHLIKSMMVETLPLRLEMQGGLRS